MSHGKALRERVLTRALQVLGALICAIVAFAIFMAFRACADADLLWREHAALKQLGSGAVCEDAKDQIVSCIKDGHAYQCIVTDDEHTGCAQVERLP